MSKEKNNAYFVLISQELPGKEKGKEEERKNKFIKCFLSVRYSHIYYLIK